MQSSFPTNSLLFSCSRFSSGSVPYKYHLAVNPIEGSDSFEGVYVSNYQTRQIIRIKKYSGLTKQELQSNYEVVAGTGEQRFFIFISFFSFYFCVWRFHGIDIVHGFW